MAAKGRLLSLPLLPFMAQSGAFSPMLATTFVFARANQPETV